MLHVDARTRLGAFDLDVSIDAAPGECLVLARPSGAGKSTILRIAAGLLEPSTGAVRCGSDTWLDTSVGINLAPERRRCGFVFQDFALFDHLSAWQNVAYPLRHLPRKERRIRADALLGQFGLLDRATARPRTLSGGERQRVAVARALAREPRVLLLDEPLSALDPRTRASAGRALSRVLREAQVPSILVTHDFAEAAVLGDRIAVIDSGRIVQQGMAAQLAATPASAFVADFTGAVVLTGTACAAPGGLTEIALDGGGTISSTEPATGLVAASIFPWEIVIEPLGAPSAGSARNRIEAEVASVTVVGGRVRVGLIGGQPMVAEVSEASVAELSLRPGVRVAATWKAAATRLVSTGG